MKTTHRGPLRRAALALSPIFLTFSVLSTASPQAIEPGYQAQVRPALKIQNSVLGHEEHCSVDPDLLRKLGRAPGQQVRVYRGPNDFAVYTVSEARDEEPETIVRIDRNGRQRLGVSDPFPARIVPTVPRSDLSDAQAKQQGELVERLRDDGQSAGLLILAPHGGDIERHTDEQADRLYEKLTGSPVVSWTIKAWGSRGAQSASARWHITSTDFDEASYPLLRQVSRRKFRYSVSFHGMNGKGILIGGAAPRALKEEVKAALERNLEGSGVPIKIAGPTSSLGGKAPRNIVNRYCKDNGIQIEQGRDARRDHWRTIADTIAEVYAPRL